MTLGMPTFLDYYEITDAFTLTKKISSIPTFLTKTSSKKQVVSGRMVDFECSCSTEDNPCVLHFISQLRKIHYVNCLIIDMILLGECVINRMNRVTFL